MKKFFLLLLCAYSLPLYAQQPPDTDIYLFHVKKHGKTLRLLSGKNITQRRGYDNQPYFHPHLPLLYYASANEEGRTDILEYNYHTGHTRKLTHTPEREYSPTVTPDEQFISCIIQHDNGTQNLGKYPVQNGGPVILVDHLTVGYHAWINNNELMLFVLGKPNTLRHYNIKNRKDTVLAENIGRSLQRIPGSNDISFVAKQDEGWFIKKFDSKKGTIETLVPTLPGREDFAWTTDGRILMSDGAGLYFIRPGEDTLWRRVIIPKEIKISGINRLAMNASMLMIAVVADGIKD
ncbi:MAG: hypothetical protein KatS3mg032_1393 [Cyclobacteriaceae bacterium]|nr:MAG: hypothetical protein KatS3mg032_1393 [Cyclobacteriaceae bacterium]